MKSDLEETLDIPAQLERRKKALTVAEVADVVSLSTKQIYALVEKGALPSYRIAGVDPV
jgi:excisionase family DNA binding protein